MTLSELKIVLQDYKEKEEQRAKEQSIISYTQATMVAQFVNLCLNGKPIPSYNKLFPDGETDKKNQEEIEYKKAMLLKEQFMF